MNNIADYCLINRKEIEEDIKKLETELIYTFPNPNEEFTPSFLEKFNKNYGRRQALKEILNKSIAAEDVITDAYKAGYDYDLSLELTGDGSENYIKNLTIKK